jgi:hypothetical protein
MPCAPDPGIREGVGDTHGTSSSLPTIGCTARDRRRVPEPGSGEVRVRVLAAGVSSPDVMMRLYIVAGLVLPGHKPVIPCSIQWLKRLRREMPTGSDRPFALLRDRKIKPLIAQRTPSCAGKTSGRGAREARRDGQDGPGLRTEVDKPEASACPRPSTVLLQSAEAASAANGWKACVTPCGRCVIVRASHTSYTSRLPVRSPIAQSVERRTVNPQVPGSSPGRGAKKNQ